MTDQGVALISIVLGALLGLAGIVASVWSAWRTSIASKALANDERRQQRLETTYLELITFVGRQRQQFDAIRPFLTFPGQPPPPAIPPTDIYRARAVAIAHASTQVWGLLDEFEEVCRSIVSADAALKGIEDVERQTGKPVPVGVFEMSGADYQKRLMRDKGQLKTIEERIWDQIRSELGAGPRTESPERNRAP